MPSYGYSEVDEAGNYVEGGRKEYRFFPMGDAPKEVVMEDGWVGRRDLTMEHGGAQRGASPACWPMVSECVGVAPDQIGEAMALDREKGVPTEYTPKGDVVFRDRAHRRDWARAHGLVDRSGGYSD